MASHAGSMFSRAVESAGALPERILPETERETYLRERPEDFTRFTENPMEYLGETLFGENELPRARIESIPGRMVRNLAAIPLSMVKPAARVAREALPAMGYGVPFLEGPPSQERQIEAIGEIANVGKELGGGLLDMVRRTVDDPLGFAIERPVDAASMYFGGRGAARGTARGARAAAAQVPRMASTVSRAAKKVAGQTPMPIVGFPQETMPLGPAFKPKISETPIAKATIEEADAVAAMGKEVPEPSPAKAAEAAGQTSLLEPAKKSPKASQTTIKADEVSFYDEFQNRGDVKQRGKLFDEEKIQGFLRDRKGFDPDRLGRRPVLIWKDASNELQGGKGRTYVLDGHHRVEMARWDWNETAPGRWSRGEAVSREIPASEIKGSLAEALEVSKDVNRGGVPNTYSENAVRAREMLKEGSDVTQVADRLRVSSSKVKDLEDFAHLDPSLRVEISKAERAIPYGVALGRMTRRYPEHFGKESQIKFWTMLQEGKGKGGIRSVSELEAVLEMEAAAIEAAKQSDMFGGGPIGISADLTKKALEVVRAIKGEGSPEAKAKAANRKLYGSKEEKWPPAAKKVMKDARARSKAVAELQKEFGPEKIRVELAAGAKAGEPVAATMDAILKRVRERIAAPAVSSPPKAPSKAPKAPSDPASPPVAKPAQVVEVAKSTVDLSPEQRAVEAKAIEAVTTRRDVLLSEMRKRFKNVVDVDDVRELFPEYSGSPESRAMHAPSVHESASVLARARINELIDSKPSGPDAYGLIMGGGAGVGKSTALRGLGSLLEDADLVSDGTLSDLTKADKLVERIRASGRRARIVYVLMDPQAAYVGTLRRAANPKTKTPGRTVPAKIAASHYAAAPGVARSLMEKYPDDVQVYLRQGDAVAPIDLARLRAIESATPDGGILETQLKAALETEYDAGRVPDYVYRGAAGKEPGRRPVQASGAGAEQGSQAVPAQGRPAQPVVPAGVAPPKKPPPKKPVAAASTPPPPPSKPPNAAPKLSIVARGLNRVAGAAEAMDRAADPGRAIEAAFNTMRTMSPAANDLGARVGEHLIRRSEQMEARRIYSKGQAEFFRLRDRESAEIVKQTRKLKKAEKRQFYRHVVGLEGLAPNASPAMKGALDWWRSKSAQEQQKLVDLSILEAPIATRRAYQPLRMERWGPESETALQELRREAERKGVMDSPAHRELDARTAKLEAELISQGKDAPVYFPMLRTVKPSDFLPSRMLKHETHGQMKLSTGKRLASGKFELDPAVVMSKVVNERLKLETAEKTIKEIMESPKIKKREYRKGEDLAPDEALFAPDGFLRFYRRVVDFSDDIAKAIEKTGSADDALSEYLTRAIQSGEFRDIGTGIAREKVWVMPKKVVDELRAQTVPVPKLVRLFFDRPIDYWRTAVLPLRPAWNVNNLIGNFVMSTLAGVSPRHYAMALREKYRAAMPDEIAQGGMVAEARTIHLGRSGDTAIGRALTMIENAPGPRHIGALADRLRAANQSVDGFFRRATYVRQAEKIARAKHLKRAAEGFHEAFDLLRAIDSLNPAEVSQALNRTNKFMGDYVGGLAPWERQWLRRIVPFYAFMKHQTKLLLSLPKDAPGKTLMMSQLSKVGEDIEAESEMALPEYLRNKGMIDMRSEFDVEYGGKSRRVRVYLATQGWNPLILGFSPSGEIRGLTTDPRGLVEGALSQTNPLVQYAVSALTQKNSLGRAFTEPGTYEDKGRFYRSTKDLKGYPEDRILDRPAGKSFVEVKAPLPNLPESYFGAFPQVNLARRMVRPESGYTAEPFSVESAAGPRSALVRTRITEALRYFSGGSFMLVDSQSGHAYPISRSTLRSLTKKRAQEQARKAQ